MIHSSKILLEAMEITDTCKQLQAICIGYKNSNQELFNYYNSFLEWLLSKHTFFHSETKIAIDLQDEIFENKRIQREKREQEFEAEMKSFESKKTVLVDTTPVNEQITYTTKTKKKPFFKEFQFFIFGYGIYFYTEVEKM